MGSDGMNKRQRKKLEARARRVTEAGPEILAYGTGTGQARLSKGLIGLLGGFAVLFLVLLVLVHVVLIPEWFSSWWQSASSGQKRGVALTSDAVLVFHESVWNGKPNRLILSSPPSSFSASNPPNSGRSRVTVLLGTEQASP